jgi:hypothetical protein
MKSAHTSVVVRIAAAVASAATTLALLAAVVSLSEPQQSQLIAATASRQTATPKNILLVAQSKQAQPAPAAEVPTRQPSPHRDSSR